MRCLLILDGKKAILIDNGIGTKQDAKFFSHFHLHGSDSVNASLRKAGIGEDDVTDMFLTHLHFDHCGGSIVKESGVLVPAFRNATYWSNEEHWAWATNPNPREKASFLSENILPIRESGQLKFIHDASADILPGFSVLHVSGHTDNMMVPMIRYKGKTICFMADLLPSLGHLPLPYLMSYDTRPLLTMVEKEKFLALAADGNYILFLEHDPVIECCTVKHTEKGVRVNEVFKLRDVL